VKRHSNRDKGMKGYEEHFSVLYRGPAPDAPMEAARKRTRRHGGLFCVGPYLVPVSVQAAQRDMRRALASSCPGRYGPQNYHGLEGLDYAVANDLARALRWEVSLFERERCWFCGNRIRRYTSLADHVRWHRQQGHKPLPRLYPVLRVEDEDIWAATQPET